MLGQDVRLLLGRLPGGVVGEEDLPLGLRRRYRALGEYGKSAVHPRHDHHVVIVRRFLMGDRVIVGSGLLVRYGEQSRFVSIQGFLLHSITI